MEWMVRANFKKREWNFSFLGTKKVSDQNWKSPGNTEVGMNLETCYRLRDMIVEGLLGVSDENLNGQKNGNEEKNKQANRIEHPDYIIPTPGEAAMIRELEEDGIIQPQYNGRLKKDEGISFDELLKKRQAEVDLQNEYLRRIAEQQAMENQEVINPNPEQGGWLDVPHP